jgi:Ca-activated chloride channel homolog
MNHRRPALLVLLLCALIAMPSVASARRKVQRSAPIEARLELAAGTVTLDGREVVYSGAALPAGSRLATGHGSRALARLADGASVFLSGDTRLRLRDDRVELEAGQCWLDAPPAIRDDASYQLGDVIVTATDAGLDLALRDGVATIYVARGLAVVSAPGGRVEVQAGELARVDHGAAPTLESVTWWQDWTGGMADNRMASEFSGVGTGVAYGVDLASTDGRPARDLEVSRLSVSAVIRDGLAETEVDQTFANPGERDLEGWYWFTVPAGATVTSFAVEHHGQLIEGEFVERREARAAYSESVASGGAPATLEWVDGRAFRARIYPVPAMGTRRVVLRYLERLDVVDGTMRFVYPMQASRPSRIGEFALSVDLGREGRRMDISTLADARVEDGGRLVTMRRSGFTPVADFQLEAQLPRETKPVRVSRFDAGGETADYVMVRYSPDIDWNLHRDGRADVVVVVDTSAAGDPETRALKTATAEAVLRALSSDDRFALMSLDVQSEVLHPVSGLAPAEPDQIAEALERLSEHANGGATDLADFFDVALARLHDGEQPAIVYVGDGLATSGELTGEQLQGRLRRTLATSRARLFTVAVGNDANVPLLEELARTGGGQALKVGHADEATGRALRLAAALKTPTITGLQIDAGAGLDDVVVSGGGKVSYGGEVTLLARTHHPLPRTIRVTGRLGGKDFERSYPVKVDDSVASAFVPRFWAHEQMRRQLGSAAIPADVRGAVMRLGLEYGLMTPFTSILTLESEAAFAQMGIQRACSAVRGVRLADGSWRRAAATGAGCATAGVTEVTGGPVARRVVQKVEPARPRLAGPSAA